MKKNHETLIDWPDITFPPVNLWVVMSASDFQQLVKDYGIFDIGQRDHYFLERESIQFTKQTVHGGSSKP